MRLLILTGALATAACNPVASLNTAEAEDGSLAAGNVSSLPVPEFESKYVELKDCYVMEQDREQGGYVKQRCEGLENAKLIVTQSDLRHDLAILRTDGSEEGLDLGRTVANGAFASLGRTVEYRGPTGKAPTSLIGRLEVARGDRTDQPDISRLFVASLHSPACVVAVIEPSADQKERARAIADSDTLPPCLKA